MRRKGTIHTPKSTINHILLCEKRNKHAQASEIFYAAARNFELNTQWIPFANSITSNEDINSTDYTQAALAFLIAAQIDINNKEDSVVNLMIAAEYFEAAKDPIRAGRIYLQISEESTSEPDKQSYGALAAKAFQAGLTLGDYELTSEENALIQTTIQKYNQPKKEAPAVAKTHANLAPSPRFTARPTNVKFTPSPRTHSCPARMKHF